MIQMNQSIQEKVATALSRVEEHTKHFQEFEFPDEVLEMAHELLSDLKAGYARVLERWGESPESAEGGQAWASLGRRARKALDWFESFA